MSLYRKRVQGARHLPGWQVALRTGVAGLAVATAQTAYAHPSGGQVVAGQASINGQGTGRVRIDQSSDRVVINWDNFSIDLGEGVDFRQPNSRSVALNRVTGPEISQIMGELTANGQVYLINGNGIVFGKDAKVDVAGLIATSADIGNEAFMAGGALRFGTPGRAGAKVINHGTITVRDAGIAAFVAPQVANDGIITAHMGRIAFGGAQAFTLDLHGDNLIRFQVGDAVTKLDDKGALVGIDGVVDARGGSVLITASAARDLVNQSVRIGAPQAASMQVGADGKVSLVAAKVAITAPGEVQVGRNVAMDLSSATNAAPTGNSKGKGGKAQDNQSNIGWVGSLSGDTSAPGQAMATNGTGGTLTISAARTLLDGTINLDGSKTGGTAHITGSDFLSFGSILSASGADAGGKIQLDAGGFSLAGRITVNAALGKGGSVDIKTSRRAIDTGDAFIDASGLHGGSIRYVSDDQIISSGKFRASGSHGFGGTIDVSAPRLDLFSAQFYAQGGIRGGRVRLGGEFQGGKALATDELPNALKLVATDAVTIDVSAIGMRGNAGEIVIWSDEKTTFLGNAIARGGLVGGVGGQIEISGKETLVYRGTVETARDGQRGGTLLLDPKNIIIADGANAPSQYGLVLQAFASSFPGPVAPLPGLEAGDAFGTSVSLDGNRLAVGARHDRGATNGLADVGAVYLFSFADAGFSAPVLSAIVGAGYTGGNNISVGSLEAGDFFGQGVSLSGLRLAVSARNDDGFNNAATDAGAVYLFTFGSTAFTGGQLAGVLGVGYSGPASLNVSNLAAGDLFGTSLSLNGDRLAVGALFDDGATNATNDAGAVYLFSFADASFTTPTLEGIIGQGYTGGKNFDLALDADDYFGSAVSLSGNRLAVGAVFDDGENNAGFSTGAVYLFTFEGSTFQTSTLRSTIGLGYSGPNDLALSTLEASDHFGSSVSLVGDTSLVALAELDDGFSGSETDTGAAYLINFSGSSFIDPFVTAAIGADYGALGGKFLFFDGLQPGNRLSAVSHDLTRLVISVAGDDGRNGDRSDSGAVYLFTFTDDQFSGGKQLGTIGAGYTPVAGFSTYGLGIEQQDAFGVSVSLDGNRLAVGAPADDGLENRMADTGAVYLFTFGDARFGAPSLQAIIGAGYSGGKNISVGRLGDNDQFGSSVSLNTTFSGLRLAVGAIGDDGLANDVFNAGAVYLFTFAGLDFAGGALAQTLNYESFVPGLINVSDARFGTSVALQDNILAVGAAGDTGGDPMNPIANAGAVHIVDLGDASFTQTPTLLATIGKGYDGGSNIDMANLVDGDRFGSAVSLDGLRLAVGAPGDDGFDDDFFNTGAVFLFTFLGNDFSQGLLSASIGVSYFGALDFTPIGIGLGPTDQDFFGSSVALKGEQLVVGASGDDGLNDTQNNAGAVYLFTFDGLGFGGTAQAGVIGADYPGPQNFALGLAKGEGFGSALAFDGDRMVVGAPGNDGRGVVAGNAGAAYLFTFGGANFAEPRLVDTLGYGFSGLNNVSIPGLGQFAGPSGQQLGTAVSLDGLRLAIGASGDSGAVGSGFGLGAVYLFSFGDLNFSSPVLEATLGSGYTGGKNVDVNLFFGSAFGASLALDGNRLAVGAPGDRGNGDPLGNGVGTVFLFTFSDAQFSGGSLVGRVGQGFTGTQSISVAGLDNFDAFGSSVALRGAQLVVGARGDDGVSGSITDSGAVYLFTFADLDFSGGTQQGLISFGATAGAKDIDLSALEGGDQFGTSVALSRDGTTLFVGADGDDGSGDAADNSGAVYQFAFGSATFESGSLIGTFGFGYTGSPDVNVSRLSPNDRFGTAVAFDADRLVIGAPGDGGINGLLTGAGAAYIFNRPSTQFMLSGLIGSGYGGDSDLPLGSLDEADFFGSALSLDGERLAIGAPGDDGFADNLPDVGAVHLFNLGTNTFAPPRLVGTVGKDYGAQQNFAPPQLNSGGNLGSAVSLRDTRLAIGVAGSGASSGAGLNRGAVYLFTFADTQFSTPVLAAFIGQGFTGLNAVDLAGLEDDDRFGASVSLDGLRLAVGAPGDDGAADDLTDAGAVYLFTFADTSFASPALAGRIGRGYVGAGNVNVLDLEENGRFGASVSLLDQRLAIGSPGADFDGDLGGAYGAVFLYTFTSLTFAGGERAGTIGRGYSTLAGDFDLARLDIDDAFGSSVALSGLGLAVGAEGDAGSNEDAPFAGAVYLFNFADTSFATPTLQAILGRDYGGGNNLSVGGVGAGDAFGQSVSLEGQLLAVGSGGDDGIFEQRPDAGAVYLFSFLDTAFSGADLQSILGTGYFGGNGDLSVIGLGEQDFFGSSVSIDAGRLVVGAPGDDGRLGFSDDFGSVYLFRYSGLFRGLEQAGQFGSGYANGRTPSLTAYGAGAGEQFGAAVSLEGLRLAVGSPLDRGGLGEIFQFGAVYLFSFADLTFSTPVLQSIIGFGYSGGKNLSVANLDVDDRFGVSVHLGSNGLLSVGADGDDGFGNDGFDRGAVYLFSFADSLFSGGSLQGIIGSGYSGAGDLNIALDNQDLFGTAVASDGQLLAVGAPGDDGSGNPGTVDASGAVHLFQLSGAAVSLLGTIGSGYTGLGDFNLVPLGFQDGFGASLSLKGRQLVVGAPFDSGKDDSGGSGSFIGAAYGFTFSPGTPFADLAHAATFGFGYDGPNDINVSGIGGSDFFGGAVSVDGTRLAINARQDSGALNDRTATGAVYLFSFADTGFTGGTLEATIGVGYTGGKNLSLALDDVDIFGYSLALDGNRLAVGSLLDDGAGNILTDSGSVYLFTFADAAFNGITLQRQMGAAYRATAALDIGAPPSASFAQVQAGDNFGAAVSLDGLRLAIGAPGDDGSIDALADAGAVYLFTFTDAQFGGAALQSVIGHGYVGGKNVFVSEIGAGDLFGSAVSLDGNRLAVGAPGDDGAGDSLSDGGAVYLFTFASADFASGLLESIIGSGYVGGKNLDTDLLGDPTALVDTDDRFGTSVSLDGNRLAVGSPGDSGKNDIVAGNPSFQNGGAVFLFSFADAAFGSAAIEARIGAGYDGPKDRDFLPDAFDRFGSAVALDGLRLAIGANEDDGAGNALSDAGAVYLFTFTDLAFGGNALIGRVGAGYSNTFDVDTTVAPFGDGFGSYLGTSVSLDGNRLAVGAPFITPGSESSPQSGAVYLLTFTDSSFGGGTIAEILGEGAAGFGANLDFNVELDGSDSFGSAVSLDGNRLVVGAVGDDGFGNTLSDSGAVYMFTFADAAFGGAQLRGNIGAGYTRGLGSPIMGIEASDGFGTAVSLNGNRLAVGAPGDDGSGNSLSGSGAVYLISFADADFAAPVLSAVIGSGYTGGNSLSVSQLRAGARFGSAVSLDGSRLAVGTPGDTGASGSRGDAGAVYLFTFADAVSFATPQLAGIIGQGYAGANDFAVTLDAGDVLGSAVSLRGTQLAVGAAGDDGDANAVFNVGAVYLFTFADLALNDAALIGRIGSGYSASGDLNVTALESFDAFGTSLSLDGLRLAVGAPGDDGDSNGTLNAGAVHLFTLGDTQFATPTFVRTLGALYLGADAVPGLGSGDRLGSAVALAGNVLAIGAPGDQGDIDALTDAGAVYIYALADPAFASDLQLTSRIGSGYLDPADIDLSSVLVNGDLFGSALTLDTGRLVIGAPGDDGPENALADSGALYFFNFSGAGAALPGLTFGDDPGADVTISASALAAILSGGTGVTLQANNDITVNSAILVNNPSGNGGLLEFNAGRSIFINAGITTDNGIFRAYANDPNAVIANRDPGFADISFGSGGFVDAGTGAVEIRTFASVNPINYPRGTITLGNITGGTITVTNGTSGTSADGQVILSSGALLTASDAADAITISGSVFTNNAGAGAFNLTGGGRFRVFSVDYDNIARGGLTGNNLYNRTLADTISQTGNLFIFSRQPILTFTADDASRFYGDANPAFSAMFAGLVNGDTASYAFSGAPDFSTLATIASNAGTYAIDPILGTLTSDVGYGFAFAPGTLTVNKWLLNVAIGNAFRQYGDANPGFTASFGGLRNGDDESVVSGLILSTTANASSPVGSYVINGSGATATNYDFNYLPGTLTIAKATLSITANDATREYGLVNPAFTGTIIGFRNGEDASVISGLTFGTVATTASSVGTYAIVGSGASATNYDFNYFPGTLTITKALLTVTADNAAREYGLANPTFTGSVTGFRNGDDATVISGLTYGTVATVASDAGTYAITGSGASATNYDFSYVPGTLTITKALLTVTANDATREYGLANPAFTGTITGYRNGDTASVISGLTFGTVATIASNVGTYAITGSGASATNYDFSYVPGTLTITRALLTVTADNATREYGLANPTFTGTITGFRNGDTAGVVSGLAYASVATTASAVGTYAITGSGGTATNYDFSYVPGTLTITKALLTVTADNASREYGLANPSFTGSITGFRNGDTASVVSGLVYNTVADINSNAGTYGIVGAGATSTNYDFAYVPGTLTITKALLTVTANDATREYGLANPAFTGSITGFRNGDTASVISGLVYGSNAVLNSGIGTYSITGSGATATNYDFSYVPGTLTITRALLTVTADNASREYGLANPAFTGTISGLRAGDTASVVSGLTYGTVATTASSVGTYAITGSGGSAANYSFAYVDGTLTITKALLTVTADDATREYGLANPAFTGSVAGFRNGDDATVISGLTFGTVATIASDAGAYAITGSSATATNYDFSYIPGTLTITKALLTVTADDATREYGLANPAFTGTITGYRNGDTASVISGLTFGTVATTASSVGTYAITGSGANATNYDFAYVPGTLTITKALLTVTADNATREYGLANPALTGTITGLRAGDTASVVSGLTYGTVATTASSVGTYAITGSGGSATNYDFAYVPGTLTITKALLTVTANDATREYGLANPSFTGSITGFRNGDTASVVSGLVYNTVADINSNAGTYGIVGAGATSTNYDFAYVPGTLTITKALLTVTANDATREYGLANPAFTGTITGYRNGDTASVINGLVYGTVATTASSVGTYAITGSGANATNYDFAYVPGTLTITKALLTVTADNATREYGLANPALTGTITGYRNGDTASVINGLVYGTVATTASSVGTYAITGSGGSATNYDFAYVDGTLTITKALLTVTADNASREYGLANPSFTGSITGFRNGDTASVVSGLVYNTVADINSNAGTYGIVGAGATSTNYDFAYVPGTLTITKALLTVTANDATREYGLANPAFTGTITGYRNGDTASVISGLVYGSNAVLNSGIGTYGITGSGATATNYDFSYVTGTLTITRALLTVTADNASREYGLANPALTGTISGLRAGDTASVVSGLSFATTATSGSSVGTYAITGSGGSAANYDFAYVPGTLTITRALLTVTANNASREYGLANPAFTGSITGFRNGDTASVVSGLTFGSVATIASNAGRYAITGSGGNAANYDFSYVPGTLTITKALLTVTADNAAREYGLANPAFTGSITGFRNGDNASVVSGLAYGSVATIASNAGSYAITGSGASATNYDFAYVPGTLTITKALLTATANDATREYGLANPAFTGTITGLRNGDTASVISGLVFGTSATSGSNVGSYAITGAGASATNYDFAYVPGTLTITKALLTVTADNASREYGLANPAFTGSIAGLRNGDTTSVVSGLVYGTTATIGSNVGSYAISGSGASATNYDFAYVPGTLTVTKALLTIRADDKAREYGLANPALTSTISGLRNGDSASVISGLVLATPATQASGIGNYAITASGGSALNYDFSYVPGTLTINPATLTVAIDNKTRTYGSANPVLTASISGFRNGDTEQGVSGLRLATNANARSNVGNYVITGSGASAANYRFDYVPGTLTITKALLQVRVNDARREYGLANPTFTASISGLRNGDTASVVTGLTFGTPATIGSDVGLYAITASGASALNYDFNYIPGRLTISQAQLTITADSKTMTQGSGEPILTVSYSGLRNGDTKDVVTGLVLRTSGGNGAAPGQYIINASRGTARNYQITYRPGVMTVLPATPPAQDPPGTGGTQTPPAGTPPPVTISVPPITLPIAGGNANPPPTTGAQSPSPTPTPAPAAAATVLATTPTPGQPDSVAVPAPATSAPAMVAMPPQGTVSLPVPPESITPLQVLQGLSAPLPVLVSPELRPAEEGEQNVTPQGDGQRGGCEYISLCNGTATPLWTWQPAQ